MTGRTQDCDTSNTQTNCLQKSKKFSYEKGISSKKFLNNGVKKIIILAAIPNIKENHENVSQILEVLKIDNIKYFPMFDYKLANIFFGIECSASTHPCVYCEMPSKDIKSMEKVARDR